MHEGPQVSQACWSHILIQFYVGLSSLCLSRYEVSQGYQHSRELGLLS